MMTDPPGQDDRGGLNDSLPFKAKAKPNAACGRWPCV
eukprot:SAG25_NODE_11152_length_312_cov_0.774648_1_plen_36_part_10